MYKVIVITGGSDGLGKAFTELLSKENKVIILSTNEEKLREVANDNNCKYKVCDVSNYKLVENAIKEIIEEYGKIDVLINNAGLSIQGELESNDSDLIKSVIEVNLLGTINMTKAVVPFMKNRKGSLIININSQGGLYYKLERSIYHASKWGVTGFTGCLQQELPKYGIRVTDVYLGALSYGMKQDGLKKERGSDGLDYKDVYKLIQFVIDAPDDVMIPEVRIKNINK